MGATGTPAWMAPELLRRESSNTAASDVYSFGIIIYEIYSRKAPYDGEDMLQVLKDVADLKVNKRPHLPPTCPGQPASLMADCLRSAPEARPGFEEIELRMKRLDADNVEPGDAHLTAHARKHAKASRSEDLLFKVFPKHIAEALRDGRKVEPEHHDLVSIFFSDVVGFTEISSKLTPIKVQDMLDRLYSLFDSLSLKHDVFKVRLDWPTVRVCWIFNSHDFQFLLFFSLERLKPLETHIYVFRIWSRNKRKITLNALQCLPLMPSRGRMKHR